MCDISKQLFFFQRKKASYFSTEEGNGEVTLKMERHGKRSHFKAELKKTGGDTIVRPACRTHFERVSAYNLLAS